MKKYISKFKEASDSFSFEELLHIEDEENEERRKALKEFKKEVEILPVIANLDTDPIDIPSKFKFFKIAQDEEDELLVIFFTQKVKNLITF